MRKRPVFALLAMAVALVSSFVLVKRTGEHIDVSFEAAGIWIVLLFGPALAACVSAAKQGFTRPLAAVATVSLLAAALLACFVVGMIGLGEGLGLLLTAGAATTVTLALPMQICAGALFAAALVCGSALFSPDPAGL